MSRVEVSDSRCIGRLALWSLVTKVLPHGVLSQDLPMTAYGRSGHLWSSCLGGFYLWMSPGKTLWSGVSRVGAGGRGRQTGADQVISGSSKWGRWGEVGKGGMPHEVPGSQRLLNAPQWTFWLWLDWSCGSFWGTCQMHFSGVLDTLSRGCALSLWWPSAGSAGHQGHSGHPSAGREASEPKKGGQETL